MDINIEIRSRGTSKCCHPFIISLDGFDILHGIRLTRELGIVRYNIRNLGKGLSIVTDIDYLFGVFHDDQMNLFFDLVEDEKNVVTGALFPCFCGVCLLEN